MLLIRRSRRRIAAALLVLVGVLPCLSVLGYGLYLRSPLYLHHVEAELTEFFGLPVRVGRVAPLSWDERIAYDIEIFLPDADGRPRPDGRIGAARVAQWVRSDQPGLYDLQVLDGELDLSPARWAHGDFSQLEKSLRHDYREVQLHQVQVAGGSVRWSRGDFALELGQAVGRIYFVGDPTRPDGVAQISANLLNGHPSTVRVEALFDPLTEAAAAIREGNGLVRSFMLTTGDDDLIPLDYFNLEPGLGRPVHSGFFRGRLEYIARDGDRRDIFRILDSQLVGVKLGELLDPVDGKPVEGTLQNLKIHELRVESGWMKRLHFAGELVNVDVAAALKAGALEPELARAGLPAFDGRASLYVSEADLVEGPIHTLKASGRLENTDLSKLSSLWRETLGDGRIHGRGTIKLTGVQIFDGRLAELNAELVGLPADASGPPTIDGQLIRAIAARAGYALPNWLPLIDLPYRNLGVDVTNWPADKIKLLSAGGRNKDALLTIAPRTPDWLGGKEILMDIPVPGEPIDVSKLSEQLARPLPPVQVIQVTRTLRERWATTQPE